MKTILSLFLFNCLFGDTLHQTPVTNRRHAQTNELLFMSTIINNVLHHHWDDEELPCLQKTLDIMRNVQNHTVWATWVWDSMQSPTGVFFGSRNQLGNYDQCIYPPWVKTHPELLTQYCIADIEYTKRMKLNDDPDLYLYFTRNSLTNNSAINKLTWGLCLPAVCKPNSIKKFAKTFLNNTHLSFALSEATISIDSCQTYNDNTELSFGYYLTVGFIGSIILLTLYSTNYYENHRYRKKENRAIQLAKAFSIIQNTAELFKEKDDEIYTLNSLKFLTSCVLIYAHSIMICVNMGLKHSKSFNHFLETNALYFFLHLDILVDTFIMISGLLLIRGFLRSNKPVTINVVIKRYIRLTYVPMVLILFTTQVSKHYGEGPLQPRITFSEVETCRNYWWTNLLTINNFVHYSNACFPVTWSIACDFHLTVLGTGLYWLYQKNRSLGLKAFFIGLIASVVLPTLVALREQLSPIQFKDLEALGDVRKHANFPTYLHSHLRSGPYFIGMAFGFLLSTYKPADYKKRLVSSSVVIFALSFGLALFIFMFGGYLAHQKYGVVSDALYIGTNRSIWAIAMGLIIVSCEYGNIPIISDFLRWPIFVPLSKLSFGIYIIHWLVLIVKTSDTMSPDKIYLSYMIIDSLGMVTFCCGLSYLLWLVFESPMNNVVAIMLRKGSYKEVEEDQNGNEAPNSVKKIT